MMEQGKRSASCVTLNERWQAVSRLCDWLEHVPPISDLARFPQIQFVGIHILQILL
jgi:hypothetical protein